MLDPCNLEIARLIREEYIEHALRRARDRARLLRGRRDGAGHGVFGFSAARATRDLDLAAAVEESPQFEAIKERFVDTGAFNYLATLHRQHGAGGKEDRLYRTEIGVLEVVNYDLDLAEARLLGDGRGTDCRAHDARTGSLRCLVIRPAWTILSSIGREDCAQPRMLLSRPVNCPPIQSRISGGSV